MHYDCNDGCVKHYDMNLHDHDALTQVSMTKLITSNTLNTFKNKNIGQHTDDCCVLTTTWITSLHENSPENTE